MTKPERTAAFALPAIMLIGGGVALAGSQHGAVAFGMPLFGLAFMLAFLMQWLAFVPAFLLRTEKFFDLTGSVTFIAVIVLAVALSPTVDARSVLLAVLVIVWAVRLGTFLVRRIHKVGKDARFDELKQSFLRFLMTWTLQGLWVALTLAAALAAITATLRREPGVFAVFGSLVWMSGFVIETVADNQKGRFRKDPANKGRFMQSGLWALSRHPNYFGEIVLWIGVAIIAAPVLRGWQWITLISPVFVYLLLTRISGVPMLETKADQTWGDDPDYIQYKHRTPVLIPSLGRYLKRNDVPSVPND